MVATTATRFDWVSKPASQLEQEVRKRPTGSQWKAWNFRFKFREIEIDDRLPILTISHQFIGSRRRSPIIILREYAAGNLHRWT